MISAEKAKQQSYFEAKAAREAAAKNAGLIRSTCQWVVDNQIVGSLVVLALIHGYDFIFANGNSALVHLQHKIPRDPQERYYRGHKDVFFIIHWVVVFTLARATIMYKVLEPFARWYGVDTARKVTRFAEQGWLTLYYITSNFVGLYVMSQGPHWMSTPHYWINYPEGHAQMSCLMKLYYLIQMGFWFQQIFVLLIEEKRKDFVVMGIHHVVTCNLLGWSLYMNYTRVGNAVLCCMDFSDIFLSGTKCIRYLGFERATVVSFVTFILTWVYTRHYLYFKILYSVVFESKYYLDDDIWNPAIGSYYSRPVIYCFTVLFIILQALIIYWFVLVLRIVYRVIFQNNLDDSRSDSEDDSNDAEDNKRKHKKDRKRAHKKTD